jgi:hypothetical protein
MVPYAMLREEKREMPAKLRRLNSVAPFCRGGVNWRSD